MSEINEELLEALKNMTRLVEAFSYTTALSKNQRERFENAKSVITKAEANHD